MDVQLDILFHVQQVLEAKKGRRKETLHVQVNSSQMALNWNADQYLMLPLETFKSKNACGILETSSRLKKGKSSSLWNVPTFGTRG